MEICPKCHQTMTWYMTYNSGNPYCGYHCNNCGYDTMNNTHTVTTSKTISINNQPKPIIQEVVQLSDDSINKIADAIVRKLAGRKIEPIIEVYNGNADKENWQCITIKSVEDKPQTERSV